MVDACATAALTVWPMIALGTKYTLAYLGLHFGARVFSRYREGAPTNMKLVRYGYDERKLLHNKLIQKILRASTMSPDEISEFQQETLQLIVAYVRAHRSDRRGTKVFSNLLVEDGDEMIVLARNQEHREPLSRVPKMTSLAWHAIKSGQVAVTGDVYDDYPETAAGKSYRSILAIPVRKGRETVAVVSVDSSRKYHFDRCFNDLHVSLQPYVSLLAWTVLPDPARKGIPGTAQ